jgi:hypothetical protein
MHCQPNKCSDKVNARSDTRQRWHDQQIRWIKNDEISCMTNQLVHVYEYDSENKDEWAKTVPY